MTASATIATYRDLYAGGYMRDNWEWRATGLDDLLGGASRVLEVGAGRGQLAQAMRRKGLDWTACDPCPSDGVELGAMPRLPYADRSFDLTVSIDVLEHLPPNIALCCMADLRRVARRGVWAVANMSDVHRVNGVDTELHLIQQPAPWWVDRIRSIGGVARVHKTDTPIRFWLDVSW